MKRRQMYDLTVIVQSDILRYFLFAGKLEVLSCCWRSLFELSLETRLQSQTMLPALTPTLPRPRHQLLLLLTKVPAAQSQGEEVVLVELVKDLLPHILGELFQKTMGVLCLPRVAHVL